MERNIPLHIERLIYDLNHSTRTEAVLLATANLISQDVTLMQVYLQLGYSLQSNQFLSSPTAQQALCLISQEYGVPLRQPNIDSFLANTPPRQTDPDTGVRHEMMKTFYEQGIDEIVAGVEIGLEVASEPSLSSVWDCFNVLPKAVQFSTPKPRKTHQSPSTQATWLFTPLSYASTPFSENDSDQGTPRSTKGLRYLTSLVKQLVCKQQPTSFKEVALKLIDELIQSEGTDRIKEEKNVRRRVYDAINVLIAAGVLERNGSSVSWKEEWSALEIDEKRAELEKRRKEVEAKRTDFKEILNKYLAIQHLIFRNANNQKAQPAIQFPFIVISTSDSHKNSMSIRVNSSATSLSLKFQDNFSMFGDMDVLLALKMHKIKLSLLNRFLPSRELLNYCSPCLF